MITLVNEYKFDKIEGHQYKLLIYSQKKEIFSPPTVLINNLGLHGSIKTLKKGHKNCEPLWKDP